MPEVLGQLNHRLAAVLSQHGFEVVVPQQQTCCGALHAHAGDLMTAKDLAKQNIAAFESSGAEFLVMNSAGCGAAIKHYDRLLQDEPEWSQRGHKLAQSCVDIASFALSQGLKPRGFSNAPIKATYDAPCHLHHAQALPVDAPSFLSQVPNLELKPLDGAELCCGAAGIYNITQPLISDAVLEEKLDALERSQAEVLITGNPGCYLQWQKGIASRGLPHKVMHLLEFL